MGAASSKSSEDLSKLDGRTWDYVIVGGGTAGCVLASRLSEDPDTSVLVLEAGKTNENVLLSKAPLAFAKLYKSEYDWDHASVPQPNLGGRKIYWPRGKILGGTSSINASVYHHCAPSDYDEWGRACDAPGEWSYEALRPYFKKAEKFHVPPGLRGTSSDKPGTRDAHGDVDLAHRGLDGVYETSFGAYNQICEDAVRACEAVGIPYTSDFNTPKGTLGAAMFAGTVDAKGHRSSAATAYLSPRVRARRNLTIVTQCRVTQLLFDDAKTRVVGAKITRVDAWADGATWTVAARRTVLLCAGTVATPQLLLLSGLGPTAELQAHGIPVVKDLPAVGQHLLDQPMAVLSFRAAPHTTLAWVDGAFWGLWALARWLLLGTGMFAAIAAQGAAFVRSDDTRLPLGTAPTEDNTSGPAAPDIELAWMAAPFINHTLTPPPPGSEVFTIAGSLVRPQSRGSVTLRSRDPRDKPLIDPRYLSTESDINVMIKTLRLMLHIGRAAPLSKSLRPAAAPWDRTAANVFWPADADPADVTDAELREFLIRNCETIYHPVGTARMGVSPESSVVDAGLKVHGVAGLRVVDASVLPNQLSGHPAAGIIALAEKASDIVKREARA